MKSPDVNCRDCHCKSYVENLADQEYPTRKFCCAFLPSKEDVQHMRAAGSARLYSNGKNTVIRLLEELTKSTNRTNVFIQRGPVTVRLEKKSASLSLNSEVS
jgi:hypothetical protein